MELVLALFAVVIQALFSGSETGLVRANWIRLKTRAGENRPLAAAAARLLDRKETTLIMTLVGTNLFIVVGSTLSERFFVHAFGPSWALLSVVFFSGAALVFGTYLPKAVAQAFPETWLAVLAAFLDIARVGLYPVTWLVARISGAGAAGKTHLAVTRTDMVFALRENVRNNTTGWLRASDAGARVGGIAARVLDFPELLVKEVMTPLDRVVAVPQEVSDEELNRRFAEHSYTRLPVFQGKADNIVGVISLRDLLYSGKRTIRLPLKVREQARAIEVMNLMRTGRGHIAIVHDERGRASGIVTLEDLLEELVGEIRSEE